MKKPNKIVSVENWTPCDMCRIERMKDLSCRRNCKNYIDYMKKEKRKKDGRKDNKNNML